LKYRKEMLGTLIFLGILHLNAVGMFHKKKLIKFIKDK